MSPWLASRGVQFQILFASVEVKCRCADELGSSCLATKHTLCFLGLYCGDVRARYFFSPLPAVRRAGRVARWEYGGRGLPRGSQDGEISRPGRSSKKKIGTQLDVVGATSCNVSAAFESVLEPVAARMLRGQWGGGCAAQRASPARPSRERLLAPAPPTRWADRHPGARRQIRAASRNAAVGR